MTLRSLLPTLTLTVAALVAVPSLAFAADGFTRSTTSLRAGPGTDYPRVERLSGGVALEIFGCLARGSWCDVSAEGERGWLPGSRIDFVENGRRMHLSGHFAGLGLTILSFGRAEYWGNHYAGRPWVNDRRWQRGDQRTAPSSAARQETMPNAGAARPDPQAARPPAARMRPMAPAEPRGAVAPVEPRGPIAPPPHAAAPHPVAPPHVAPAPHPAANAAQPPHPAPGGPGREDKRLRRMPGTPE